MWTPRVTVCTDGPAPFDAAGRAHLERNHLAVVESAVGAASADAEGMLVSLQLATGGSLPCRALFFDTACPQKSALAESLGCTLDETGAVRCQGPQALDVPGVFLAGNIRRGLHLAITAAAEGVEAARAINEALHQHDLA